MKIENFRHSLGRSDEIAILITLSNNGFTHTGILHQYKGSFYLLELRWHGDLRNDPASSDHKCVIPDLDTDEKDAVSRFCRLVGNCSQNEKLPYAFSVPQDMNITAEGEILLGTGFGLTCANLVLLIFNSAGIPLADIESWKAREDDKEFQQKLVAIMQENHVSSAHIAKVACEIPCIRIRPEEVAASALFENPAEFTDCERGGQWIRSQLAMY